MTEDRTASLDALVAERLPIWTAELVQFCRFSSEEDDRDALLGAADWTAERLRALGAEVEVLELDGAPPLVVGEIGDGPVLSCVQHYDVQPAAPLDLWTTPPYEPDVRDGRLFARGATDNKGELLPRIWAARRTSRRSVPCPAGSASSSRARRSRARATSMPCWTCGRTCAGRTARSSRVVGSTWTGGPTSSVAGGAWSASSSSPRTIAHDAHSSLAMVLPNAAVRMTQALATMWDADGLPAIEGLDAGALEPTEAAAGARRRDPGLDARGPPPRVRGRAVPRRARRDRGAPGDDLRDDAQRPGPLVRLHGPGRQHDRAGRGPRPDRHPVGAGPGARRRGGRGPCATSTDTASRTSRSPTSIDGSLPGLLDAARPSDPGCGRPRLRDGRPASRPSGRRDVGHRADVAGLRPRRRARRRASAPAVTTAGPTLPTRTSASRTWRRPPASRLASSTCSRPCLETEGARGRRSRPVSRSWCPGGSASASGRHGGPRSKTDAPDSRCRPPRSSW